MRAWVDAALGMVANAGVVLGMRWALDCSTTEAIAWLLLWHVVVFRLALARQRDAEASE
jgi:hypothetical protein